MLNEKDGEIQLEDLMSANSLSEYLDVNKAVTFGQYIDKFQSMPEFQEKFGEEVNAMFKKFPDYQDKLSEVINSLTPNSSYIDLLESGIGAYEAEDDKCNVAVLLSMYVAHCMAESKKEDE